MKLVCPVCSSERIRIVFTDDECTEVDFCDCTICSTVFSPDGSIIEKRD